MNRINIQYFKTPFGELILGSYDNKLCLADWRYRKMRPSIDNRIQKGLNAEYFEDNTDVIKQAIIEFNEYFTGDRKEFTISLLFVGTDFQKRVWEALLKIPALLKKIVGFKMSLWCDFRCKCHILHFQYSNFDISIFSV